MNAYDDTIWQLRAACRGHDSDIWFTQTPDSIALAKTVCRRCPSLDQCREYGFTQDHGTWGGLSEAERRRVRRKRRLMGRAS